MQETEIHWSCKIYKERNT